MGVVLAVLVGLPMIGAALDALPGWNIREEEVLAPTNPGWYLGKASDAIGGYYGFGNVRLDVGYLFGYVVIYALASFALVAWMRASFDRLAGRA